MKKPAWYKTLFALLLIPAISACQVIFPSPTPTPTASQTPTASLSPTATLTHSPTRTLTPTPTPTYTPTPTFTPTPPFLVLPQTPLPAPLATLSPENALQVSGVAAWQENYVTDLAWTPDSQYLAVAFPSGISLYDIQTRTRFRTLYPKGENVIQIAFNPTGSWLVAGSRSGTEKKGYASSLELWLGPGWQPMGQIYGEARGLSSFTFSPDGNFFVTAFASPTYEQNDIYFWNTGLWQITGTMPTGPVLNVAFSPDGKLLATTPDRYAIKVWDLEKKELRYQIDTSFTGAVNCLTFMRDGALMASGHYDGSIHLWNAATGDQVKSFSSEGVVQSLAFSPDGQLLASGSSYQKTLVRLWSVGSGELLRTLEGHNHAVDNLIFSPDGQLLVSSSYDGEVRLWGIRP